MATRYSTYEAKARFCELIRMVREGRRIRITLRGEEVAEIVPVQRTATELELRLKDLEETGRLGRGGSSSGSAEWAPVKVVPGALETFLEERE